MSELDKIEITIDKTNITLSNVVPSTPAQISDLSDMPIDTGWSVTNETETKTFDASNTSLNEIADVLGTLIEKMKTAGILVLILFISNIVFADGEFGDIPSNTAIAAEEGVCRNAADNGWESCALGTGGGGASELSDLSDVNTSTPTNRNVLVADGIDFESRALVESDISDLTHTTAESTSVTDTAEIDLTLTGSAIKGDLIAGSIDETKLDVSTNASLDLADSALQSESDTLQTVTNRGATSTNTITLSPSGNNNGLIANGSGSGDSINISHAGSGDQISGTGFTVDNSGNVTGNNLSGTNTGDQTIPVSGVDFDPVGTDNSTDVTLSGTGTYLSIAGQAITVDPITESDISDLGNYVTWQTIEPSFTSSADDVTLDVSAIGGTNFFEIATAGTFFKMTSNPGASNDDEMFAFTETQGADTNIIFYEGGTGNNRIWNSGSMRLGGNKSSLCSTLTSDVDCNTSSTGADLVVQDDIWAGGKIFATDWTDISVTESQISDLAHTTISTDIKAGSFGTVIDGGGSAITTGQKGYISIPYACTITDVKILLDQSGSLSVDLWKDIEANYPPVDADSICASDCPSVSTDSICFGSGVKKCTSLTGWTTAVTAGDIIGFNVDSITTATRATLTIGCTKDS